MLELDRVSKALWRGPREAATLEDVTLSVGAGQLVALHGGRHSGKTTLLCIAAGLVTPDAGVVRLDGADLAAISEDAHRQLLRDRVGWARCGDAPAYDMPALQHVAFPLLVERGLRAAERRAAEALALVGAERCRRTTWDGLFDVERTLVTLARALAQEPALLLVDDPTVGLDAADRARVVELLRDRAESAGTGVLMTVGDAATARQADRVYTLRDGRVTGPLVPPSGRGHVIRFPGRP